MANIKSQKDYHKTRSYKFCGILYPEHFENDRKKAVEWIFRRFQTQGAISPLHDSDVKDECEFTDFFEDVKLGDLKKAHWHFVLKFKCQHSLSELRKIIEKVGKLQTCVSLGASCRYFFHLDNPEKFQYYENDYEVFLFFPFEKYIHEFEEFEDKLETLQIIIIENNIKTFSDLLYFLRFNNKFHYLMSFACQKMFFIKEYLKACYYEKEFCSVKVKREDIKTLNSEYLPTLGNFVSIN